MKQSCIGFPLKVTLMTHVVCKGIKTLSLFSGHIKLPCLATCDVSVHMCGVDGMVSLFSFFPSLQDSSSRATVTADMLAAGGYLDVGFGLEPRTLGLLPRGHSSLLSLASYYC